MLKSRLNRSSRTWRSTAVRVDRYLGLCTPKFVQTCFFWRPFNVPLLLVEKPLFARFSHHGRLYGHFPWRHRYQPGRLPRLTGKCVSCDRSHFGVVDENDFQSFHRGNLRRGFHFLRRAGLGQSHMTAHHWVKMLQSEAVSLYKFVMGQSGRGSDGCCRELLSKQVVSIAKRLF